MRRLLVAVAGMLSGIVPSVATAQGAPPAVQPAILWSQMARGDLQALHDLLGASHPGPVDPIAGQSMRAWLEKGLVESEALAARTTGEAGLEFTIRHYADGFNDGHVIIYPKLVAQNARWPGFAVALRSGAFVVAESAEPSVPAGAAIVACDGRTPAAIESENVAPYYGIEGAHSDLVGFAPYILADFGNPFVTLPQECTISVGGKVVRHELNWQRITAPSLKQKLRLAAYGSDADLGINEWRPRKFWIGMPFFQFTRDDGSFDPPRERQMRALIDKVKSRAAQLRAADVIVFDVRGNDGGSSMWGDMILDAIFGDHFVDNLARRQSAKVEWRVSAGNIAANEHYLEAFIAEFGADSEQAKFYRTLVDAMRGAKAAGQELMDNPGATAAQPVPTTPKVHPKIILLSNGTCASACEDFADAIMSIQRAEVWGEDTRPDTVYIENRGEDLPSGLFRVSLPMKVYRGRPRGNNEAYIASRRYPAPFGSSAEARKWVDQQLATAATPLVNRRPSATTFTR